MNGDIKKPQKPQQESNDNAARAPIRGPLPPVVGGAVAADRVLWQNDYFAITDEGLLVKPSRVCIIPKRRLPEVGTEALSFVAAYPIDQNPFVAAVHHALKLLCPEQWPTGLVDPELAE